MPEFVMKTENLTHSRAAEIAAAWGSMMNATDPGAIFYTFDGKTRPSWSDEQKRAALRYADSCLEVARRSGSGPTDADKIAADVADLEALKIYISGEVGRTLAELDEFTRGFLEALFFSETTPGVMAANWFDPENLEALEEGTLGGTLPADVGPGDIAPEYLEVVKDFCAAFQKDAAGILQLAYGRNYDAAQAGRDLYFTHAGHGVGYWSRAELVADDLCDQLTDKAGRGEVLADYTQTAEGPRVCLWI
jgi:hypothetical protein